MVDVSPPNLFEDLTSTKMDDNDFLCVDANEMAWEERFNENVGAVIFR